ncbi:MAG: manganese efflux pump [Firmicutes bacterium]|nr:manganese efflux pump [Bacillota bacterium]
MLFFIINSALLGIGLAMDAFSVSLANGLAEPGMRKGRMNIIAGTFGGFQAAMPLIGWICVHTIAVMFEGFQALIPWIALILLFYIGGKMLLEGINSKGTEEESIERLDNRELVVQGIATSIDALSVGFAIADYNLLQAVLAAAIIAAVTYVICMFGLVLGKKAGTKLAGKAEILGGIILIGIGIEIFVSSMF